MSLLQRISERFWFVPALLCLAAFVLAEGLIVLDEYLGTLSPPSWLAVLLYRVGENGSRDILGAIASSSLAVAGTTFSITIAVLALTSSSYGPRLVRNFMTDRGNQMVLGVYVATFLYSLLVLRSIRVIGDPGDQEAEVFVPHLAVNAAVLLAVANVAVLIYFIHHISDSIQIWTLASRVRTDLRETVDRLYPDAGRDPGSDEALPGRTAVDGVGLDPTTPGEQLPQDIDRTGMPVTAQRPGYVQAVDGEKLFRLACDHDVLLALRVRPGEYVLHDTVAVVVHPATKATDAVQHAVRAALRVADARSPHQDVEFAVQQLTEMAVRALSPGTNDPYTAVNALDDLSAGLALLASRPVPSPARLDEDGALRLHAPRPDVVELVTSVLDSMRWYAASAPPAMHAALELVERVGRHTGSRDVRARLVGEVALLEDAFAAADHHPHDVRTFGEHAGRVRRTVVEAGLTAGDAGGGQR